MEAGTNNSVGVEGPRCVVRDGGLLCGPLLDLGAFDMIRPGRHRLWQVTFYVCLGLVLYLSFRPISDVRTIFESQVALMAWLEHHDFVKNCLGFGVLNFVGLMAWRDVAWLDWRVRLPWSSRDGDRRIAAARTGLFCLFLMGLISGIELVQALFLPGRTGDIMDVIAGDLATVVTYVAFLVVLKLEAMCRARVLRSTTATVGSNLVQ